MPLSTGNERERARYARFHALDRGDKKGEPRYEGDVMSGRVDKVRGRTKKAAGEVSGDRSLKQEGRVDKASGAVKRGVDKVAGALRRDTRRSRRGV